MTHEEIYKLYRKTDYDKPKLLKVLADVCSITVEDLKQIIKDGDEKSMPKGTRWTDEQHTIYERMTAENAKADDIAAAMGCPIKAVYARRSNDRAKLKSIHEPKGKPAKINKDFDDLFDCNDTYTDCAPDIDNGEDISDINAKIADLCEIPDPIKSKPDYTESLLETLREAEEFREPIYFMCDEKVSEQEKTIRDQDEVISKQNELILLSEEPPKTKPSPAPKSRTIFDEAHAALWSLESMAKRNGITTENIVLKIDSEHLVADAANFDGYDAVGMNKKNPLAGTAIPTSGEA